MDHLSASCLRVVYHREAMHLDFEAFAGLAGDALRTQRGAHLVYATGTLVVLATRSRNLQLSGQERPTERAFSPSAATRSQRSVRYISSLVQQELVTFDEAMYLVIKCPRPSHDSFWGGVHAFLGFLASETMPQR